MSEQLNTKLVNDLIKKRGLKFRWVYKEIGIGITAGTLMLNRGVLPVKLDLRNRTLQRLATLLGVDERQLIVRLEAKTA